MNYMFSGMEKSKQDHCEHGVSFVVRNSLAPMVEYPTATSESVMSLRISLTGGFADITRTCVPTLYSVSEEKEFFYHRLDSHQSSVSYHRATNLFTGRLQCYRWISCYALAIMEWEKMNENRWRLLECCTTGNTALSKATSKVVTSRRSCRNTPELDTRTTWI